MKNENFQQAIRALYLTQARPNLANCYRIVKEQFLVCGIKKIPTLSEVRTAIGRIPEAVISCARG